jgi:mRNA interferase MazF
MVNRGDFCRFDVYLVSLEPTMGSEIQKMRPCVIISPDEMNKHIQTVIIAPMTSTAKSYPTRVNTTFKGTKGQIVLEQIRTVDKKRLVKRLGTINEDTNEKLFSTLFELFRP